MEILTKLGHIDLERAKWFMVVLMQEIGGKELEDKIREVLKTGRKN